MTDQHADQQRTEQHGSDDRSRSTHGVKRRLTSLSWLVRAVGVGLSSVSIGFVVLFMIILDTGGELTLITRPLPMQIALVFPYLIGVLTLGTTVGTLLAWRNHYWSLPARIHQTLLALLGLAFSWQLSILGFM